MISTYLLPIILSLLSGGFITAVSKMRPERDSLAASAAETAQKVYEGSVARLERDLVAANQRITELQRELTESRMEVARLQGEVVTLRKVTIVNAAGGQ